VDDILIFSPTPEQHVKDVARVLQALGKANFRVSLKKSILGVEKIHYLGHILTPGQVQQDPAKIESMKNFPEPGTIRAVRRFIGMTGFYRRFIKGYAKTAGPLMELTSGKGKISLNDKQRHAFQQLKEAMTTAPVLQLYQARRDTRVEVDSCGTGVGAVLAQKVEGRWRPVADKVLCVS